MLVTVVYDKAHGQIACYRLSQYWNHTFATIKVEPG